MKLSITLILLTCAILFIITYTTEAQDITKQTTGNYSKKTLKNIAVDDILLKVFESGDVSKLDAIIAQKFVNHQSVGDLHGLDTLKNGVNQFHAMMHTVKLQLVRRWADDEFVNDWVMFSSVETGRIIEGMEVTRYENGKAVEHFFFLNGQSKK